MAKRKKMVIAPVETRAEMERIVREICELSIMEDDLRVRLDEELLRVREHYDVQLAEIKPRVDLLLARAETWAMANPEAFGSRKSIVMVHGTVGYRTGTPKLKTLPKWTWAMVLEKLKALFPAYVRTKEEVDKDALLADREKLGARLPEVGVQVVRDESFYVEPNREVAS